MQIITLFSCFTAWTKWYAYVPNYRVVLVHVRPEPVMARFASCNRLGQQYTWLNVAITYSNGRGTTSPQCYCWVAHTLLRTSRCPVQEWWAQPHRGAWPWCDPHWPPTEQLPPQSAVAAVLRHCPGLLQSHVQERRVRRGHRWAQVRHAQRRQQVRWRLLYKWVEGVVGGRRNWILCGAVSMWLVKWQ